MKTKKIVAITMLSLIPLGLFADGHNDGNKKECSNKNININNDFIKNKGVNFIFEGEVLSKPKSGFNGTWKISGMNVIVDDSTIIIMEEGDDSFFKDKDDEVNVLAKRENGKIKAIQIKVD